MRCSWHCACALSEYVGAFAEEEIFGMRIEDRDNLQAVFEQFDADGSGYIDEFELKAVSLCFLQEHTLLAPLDKMDRSVPRRAGNRQRGRQPGKA